MRINKPLLEKLSDLTQWNWPLGWTRIQTIDMHTAGEPLRVIISGFPQTKANRVLGHRNEVKKYWDHLRTSLMWEPRGHADMYGCLLVPPQSKEADFGILFLHNEGYSSMCGHAIIAITKLVVEAGLVEMEQPETCVKIDAPAGLVTAYAKMDGNKVSSVYFHNVPSFVVDLDERVEVPELGSVIYDLAYGGAFYAYVQAKPLGLDLMPENFSQLIDTGMAIKRAIMKQSDKIVHPFEEDLSFLYGTIFIGKAQNGGDNRNVCIFAEGEVDRSPTGTGVSGRVAIHHARGELKLNEPMIIESILGTKFTGKVVAETNFGSYAAIIPEVEGNAYITGRHEFLIDPSDPLKDGFIFR